jgi:hypothetical protein
MRRVQPAPIAAAADPAAIAIIAGALALLTCMEAGAVQVIGISHAQCRARDDPGAQAARPVCGDPRQHDGAGDELQVRGRDSD